MHVLAQPQQPPTTLGLLRLLRNMCAGNAPVAQYMLQEGVFDAIARASGHLQGETALGKATAQLLCNAATTDPAVACGVWNAAWPHTVLALLRGDDRGARLCVLPGCYGAPYC